MMEGGWGGKGGLLKHEVFSKSCMYWLEVVPEECIDMVWLVVLVIIGVEEVNMVIVLSSESSMV